MEILIAMPQLQDPNFRHTIMLLTEFTKKGAMGFVLNRPLHITKDDFVSPQGEKLTFAGDLETCWGGPVQNDLGFIIHEDPNAGPDSVALTDGLFLSGSMETLNQLLQSQREGSSVRFRFFLGYAGWSPGQLEQEMSESSWLTVPLSKEILFSQDYETLWGDSLEHLGVEVSQLTSIHQKLAH